MPKRERNKQFCKIEKKIRTNLFVRQISTEKTQIHFDEFKEIKSTLESEFALLDMSLSEGIRWLYLRWLSVNKKKSVEVEKRTHKYLTAADLEMTEEQYNIQSRKIAYYKRQLTPTKPNP